MTGISFWLMIAIVVAIYILPLWGKFRKPFFTFMVIMSWVVLAALIWQGKPVAVTAITAIAAVGLSAMWAIERVRP
jgi:hypothetical protein